MKFVNVAVNDVDLQTRAAGRVLKQFSRSEVLLSVLWGLVSEIQTLSEAIMGTMRYRMPKVARGENLNTIGRIVGQDRVLIDYAQIAWFAPDTPNRTIDTAPVWTTGAPLYDVGEADDELYRTLIQAKVSRNFCKYGSITEIQSAIYEGFGTRVSFQKYKGRPLEATILIESTALLHVIGFLTKEDSDSRADAIYLPPYPTGFRVSKQMFFFDATFRPDSEFGAPDISQVTTGFNFQVNI